MDEADQRDREIRELRERLSRLSEASIRIIESLDFETVLQGVLDSARSLTGARYSLITTLGQDGQAEDFLVSGLSADESRQLWELPEGLRFFEHLSNLPGPLRVGDFAGHMRALGLPELPLPVPVSSFLAAPIRHRGEGVGNINVAKSEPGTEFSREDEETLVMFASQAALVIANARRHREEQRTRAGPVSGPLNARSWVALSMGGAVAAAARKPSSPCSVSHTTSRGRGRPAPAIRR